MPETITRGCGGMPGWNWAVIMADLREQGGLDHVIIDPATVTPDGQCGGQSPSGAKFLMTWFHEKFLLISVTVEDQALIDAFSKVVGYKPFCRYIDPESGCLTFEWDMVDPAGRYAELESEEKQGLRRLE